MGVLLVRRHTISKFVLWTLAPKTYMPLEMMLVANLWAICKPCSYFPSATHEVAICTGNIVIPALGAGILFKAQWLEYTPAYFIQHLSVCLPLPIQSLLRNIVDIDWNW